MRPRASRSIGPRGPSRRARRRGRGGRPAAIARRLRGGAGSGRAPRRSGRRRRGDRARGGSTASIRGGSTPGVGLDLDAELAGEAGRIVGRVDVGREPAALDQGVPEPRPPAAGQQVGQDAEGRGVVVAPGDGVPAEEGAGDRLRARGARTPAARDVPGRARPGRRRTSRPCGDRAEAGGDGVEGAVGLEVAGDHQDGAVGAIVEVVEGPEVAGRERSPGPRASRGSGSGRGGPGRSAGGTAPRAGRRGSRGRGPAPRRSRGARPRPRRGRTGRRASGRPRGRGPAPSGRGGSGTSSGCSPRRSRR